MTAKSEALFSIQEALLSAEGKAIGVENRWISEEKIVIQRWKATNPHDPSIALRQAILDARLSFANRRGTNLGSARQKLRQDIGVLKSQATNPSTNPIKSRKEKSRAACKENINTHRKFNNDRLIGLAEPFVARIPLKVKPMVAHREYNPNCIVGAQNDLLQGNKLLLSMPGCDISGGFAPNIPNDMSNVAAAGSSQAAATSEGARKSYPALDSCMTNSGSLEHSAKVKNENLSWASIPYPPWCDNTIGLAVHDPMLNIKRDPSVVIVSGVADDMEQCQLCSKTRHIRVKN